MKKAKRKDRKKIVKKLDKVFSEYIRLRDGACVVCGSRENLQAGHLITRQRYSTRWDEDNVFCQCRSCNFIHEYRPEIFTSWYIEKYGADKYQKLVKKSQEIKKYSINDLEILIDLYKQKINKLKGGENNGA